ncbi:putative glycosyltransferase [Solidesulfovibrio magneticus RS-1]|uniref:Glycosyltransferase n=1 Tax=Solidesulfovibrio magneticus (strain ATCC 700980 / DSM 13731 / RS-1) TaxID=573370 RepID=C4XGL9_SOLM1|nr:putative glycosyltransferase [Solidesulfovibrio magneticus RS-1]
MLSDETKELICCQLLMEQLTLMGRINIVTSDKGWILEKLATEITSRVPYTTYTDAEDLKSDIQYYITYSRRIRRFSPIEIACYTHQEHDKEAANLFFSTASEVEYCICMSKRYEDVLRGHGLTHVSTISPGVDLDELSLKIRIGVVGRTYHTGRKGEHLVAAVMDIPEIEWHFTGEGWPGPAENIPADKMADFYRDMDYILVPALYEGGPMCVVEALACGREVIASSVGWVDNFPHIPFKNGDANDLRRVLKSLVEQKSALRAAVAAYTWDNWAESHDRLFRDLLARHGRPPIAGSNVFSFGKASPTLSTASFQPALILHGNESNSKGGPSLRVPRTAKELRNHGFSCEVVWNTIRASSAHDLVHLFNIWSPQSALRILRQARSLDKPVVFSPIYLDLHEHAYWSNQLLNHFKRFRGSELETVLTCEAKRLAKTRPETILFEPLPGFHSYLHEAVSLADHTIFLSQHERDRVAALGICPEQSSIIHNPVDSDFGLSENPQLFAETHGLREYILCVGRIEPRKNQLMLALATRDLDIPVVLLGHSGSQQYTELIYQVNHPNLVMIDRLPNDSALLRSAYAGARVVTLPSWAEGASLAALEAASTGASMVLGNRSSELEYFGNHARYCDPAHPGSIRDAIVKAWDNPRHQDEIQELRRMVADRYSWERYAAATADAYRNAVVVHSSKKRPDSNSVVNRSGTTPTRLVFDVTTSANHRGRITGIARHERNMALALLKHEGLELCFIVWHDPSRQFIEVHSRLVEHGLLPDYLKYCQPDKDLLTVRSMPGAPLLVCGSAWMQNSRYTAGLLSLVKKTDLRLTFIINDIIPVKFPYWFQDNYAPVFNTNLRHLLIAAHQVLAISRSSANDVEQFALDNLETSITVSTFELGSAIIEAGKADVAVAQSLSERLQAVANIQQGFVLCVGAIHPRKNHRLLFDVWTKLNETMGNKTPVLIIVGGVAWCGEDVARAFQGSPLHQKYVRNLTDITDSELQWLYENCQLTVYPSLYEGWGLPVAESLRYGKICLASNTSSIPEIAPNLTDLLDPLDASPWAQRIAFYCKSKTARAQREEKIGRLYQPKTWEEAASSLLQCLGTTHTAPSWRYLLGSLLRGNCVDEYIRYFTTGWHTPEHWGIWSAETTASIKLNPTPQPQGDMILAASCMAVNSPSCPFICTPSINGTALHRWVLDNRQSKICFAYIPQKLIDGSDAITVDFTCETLTHIGTAVNKNDSRYVGLGIKEIALTDAGQIEAIPHLFTDNAATARLLRPGDSIGIHTPGLHLRNCVADGQVVDGWGVVVSEGKPVRLSLSLLEFHKDAVLEFLVRPVATTEHPVEVFAFAQGKFLTALRFADDAVTTVTLCVPQSAQYPGMVSLNIEFVGTSPLTPSKLGIGSSDCQFSLGFFGLRMGRQTSPSRYREAWMTLGKEYGAAEDCAQTPCPTYDCDWYPPEPEGRWSIGALGTLRFQLADACDVPLLLGIEATLPPQPNNARPRLKVALNDVSLRNANAPNPGRWRFFFFVSPDILRQDNSNTLTISTDTGMAPFKLGLPDERHMGVQLHALRMDRIDAESALRNALSSLTSPVILSDAMPCEMRNRLHLTNQSLATGPVSGTSILGDDLFSVAFDAEPGQPLPIPHIVLLLFKARADLQAAYSLDTPQSRFQLLLWFLFFELDSETAKALPQNYYNFLITPQTSSYLKEDTPLPFFAHHILHLRDDVMSAVKDEHGSLQQEKYLYWLMRYGRNDYAVVDEIFKRVRDTALNLS